MRLPAATRKKRDNPEEQLQKKVAEFLGWALIPPTFFTAFPAGGGGVRRGARLKAMGLRAGVPDLLVIAPGCPVIMIELKADKGGLSPIQRVVHGELTLAGVRTYVAKTVDHVASILRQSGIPLRTRLT